MMACLTCQASESPKWYGNGTECRTCYAQRRHRKIYAERPEYFRERMRDYKRRAPDAIKSSQLKTTFGITLDDYASMLAAQGGCCAICKSSSPGRSGVRYFAVDHCHKTDKVRALLCAPCNTGIGLLQEDSAILLAAVAYLKLHNAD